ncbi:hypothetical protein M5689_022007 [Euphorbia peplus]|nr:hypothetical protein M5689_022007 [Euphorbia peplus]
MSKKNLKSKGLPPPQRGQIKAQILESFAKSVGSAFSKAGEALIIPNRPIHGGDGNNFSASNSPLTCYTSDGNT